MKVIYQPRGRAREYSRLAANIYTGCSHGCRYCYAPLVLHKDREEFHKDCEVRKNFFESLEKQASGNGEQVLLCFTSDPYQPLEKQTLATRKTIKMLHEGGYKVCVLTKSPTLAFRDVDLYSYGDTFATTLTFSPDKYEESIEWEPLAELPHQRIMGLRAFHDEGVRTWVSLEPVVDVDSVFENIRLTHQYVDHYKIGKLNYMKSNIDWRWFANSVVSLLKGLGKDYKIKEDLKEYLDES